MKILAVTRRRFIFDREAENFYQFSFRRALFSPITRGIIEAPSNEILALRLCEVRECGFLCFFVGLYFNGRNCPSE